MTDSSVSTPDGRLRRARIVRVLSTVLGLVLFVVLTAYAGAVGYTAVTLPECARCHLTGDFARATGAASHASVECSSCHGGLTVGSRVEFANAQVLGMYLRLVDIDPALAAVQQESCVACHDRVFADVVETGGLRILHSECAQTRTCTECHSTVAHADAVSWPRTTSMEMCFDCHGGDGITDDCMACHTGRLARDRISTGTFAVTHGPEYLQTHGMGRMSTCVPCHQPQRCAGCHGAGLPHGPDFMRTHARSAMDADARCQTCHQATFCSDCHVYEMPHTVEFVRGHASTIETDGEDGCRRCHQDPDCTECHERHVHPVTAEQLMQFGFTPRSVPRE